MKLPALLLIVLLFCPSAPAEPIRHKKAKAIAVLLLTAAVSAWEIKASHDCRERAGIEHCFGGYGARKAMVGIIVGGQAVGATMSLWGLHEDFGGWWIPAATSNAIFGINAIKQGSEHAQIDVEEAHAAALKYQLR